MAGNARIRVLIADDHAVLRAGLRLLLDTQPDMEVVGEAETAEQAIALDAELQPDVLLMDLTLPPGRAIPTRFGLGWRQSSESKAGDRRHASQLITKLGLSGQAALVRYALQGGCSKNQSSHNPETFSSVWPASPVMESMAHFPTK